MDHEPERIAGGLIAKTVVAVVGLLRTGEVSNFDLLDALEQRIAAVDGAVGALPTLCFDRARVHAHLGQVEHAGIRRKMGQCDPLMKTMGRAVHDRSENTALEGRRGAAAL